MKFAGGPTIGDGPGIWLGEFHVVPGTGDLPGDVSSLIACAVGKAPMVNANGGFGCWFAVTNPLGCDNCAEVGN